MLSSHLLLGLLALVPAVLASPVAVSTIQNRDLISTDLESRGTIGRRGFWGNCQECKLIGAANLSCLCVKEDGIHVSYSNLNLNLCIGVDADHNLIWQPNGYFASKCDKIGASLSKVEVMNGMSLPQLRASCNKEQYRPDAFGASFINLDDGIHVNNGKLVCKGSE
ncbi:hypothetical protein QBC37DRAFT_406264 [Rhypophila decipiens]|uniref:Cyanovirin-N domain-containing protein n=1 Tax=Rhypophila decipiens TaxID=261697 RepID=A0AAN7B212_9PEZI|nr:hypothetical protein QBC37DRAFT_406264 [Rhypophila decipiens]